MKLSNIELPSNRKFGLFFTFVFFAFGVYLLQHLEQLWFAYLSLLVSLFLLLITIFKAELLLPFNKLWMGLGLILGMIVSPIVLGIIFFGMFTPIAIIMYVIRRDELRLRLENKSSYWILRDPANQKPTSFSQQF